MLIKLLILIYTKKLGCKETLIDTCLLAIDKHWHPDCFCCDLCQKPLENGEFYLIENKPYDLDCHWEKRMETCLKHDYKIIL